MRQKRYLAVFVFINALLWFVPACAQFDVSLSPLLVQIELAPGARRYFSLYVNNDNVLKDVSLIAYTMDIEETREGMYKVVDKGRSEYSCADWMRIEDTSFTLGPDESREVKVYISTPPGVFGGRYGAVVFEIVPDKAPAGEKLGAVEYHFRVPAFVEVSIRRFGGLVRKASISDFDVEALTGRRAQALLGQDGLRFKASVANEGNIHLDGKGSLTIKTKEGRVLRRVPLGGGRGVVIPGATVDFESYLRKPPVGEYIARAVISFGGLSPSVAEVPFVVTRQKSSAAGTFAASAALALDVKPENLEFKTPPRGFRAATFSLRNGEPHPVTVKVLVKDLEYDPDGGLSAPDSTETGRSCRHWIQVEPAEFTIESGKRQHVRFTVQAPEQGEGGYYACLVFDAVSKGGAEGTLSTPFQIPVIMSIPPGLDLKAEIAEVQIEASAGRAALLGAYLQNTGNIHFKPQGKVYLEKLKEVETTDVVYVGKIEYEKVDEFPFEEALEYVLPGGARTMLATYPGALGAGKYRAEISIDYGGTEPLKMTKEFQVK
jgi:P pilus assembly chaperone PapD